MQARALPHESSPNRDTQITILIAYDTFEMGRRAMAVYERLTERLGSTFEFCQQLWKFDLLQDDLLRQEAAREAAQADIVIVAIEHDTELPETVRRWLEESLHHHTGAAALVALMEHGGTPVQPFLEDLARRGGMDFFAQRELESNRLQTSSAPPSVELLGRPENGAPRRLAAD